MSIQPPKIDSRSYEDIVAQTQALVEDFTISEVLPQDFEKLLLGRTLAEEVKDEHGLIASFSGKVIDKDLVDKIIKIQGLKRVKVKGWQPPGSSEIDPKDKSRLAGLILNQDLKDRDAKKKIATRGTVIDTVLAEKLSKIEGLSRVNVKMQPPGSIEVEPNALVGRTLDQDVKDNNDTIATRGTVVDATLAERISQISSLKVVKVKVETDAGMGLIRIFGRMAALVSDRLNQAPEKNFLAFLDLIGTQILPPQPARVPLTFKLVEGSSVEALVLVPAGTQVSAPPLQSEDEEVVFETERDLAVVSTQLKAVFVRDPSQDKYSDRTQDASDNKNNTFHAFRGDESIEQCFYFTIDDVLFVTSEIKPVKLTINSPEASDTSKLPPMSWSYFDGTTWKDISVETAEAINNQWEITIQTMPIIPISKIDALEGRWLRAGLNKLKLISQEVVTVNYITASSTISVEGLAPDLCFFNSTPLDISKDFYPFGEQPRFNDTFYIASREVFAKADAEVNITVTLSQGVSVYPDGGIQLAWEYWDGHKWKQTDSTITDESNSFKNKGNIKFTRPPQIVETTVNGETNYWLRVRIVAGNYGTQAVGKTPIITRLKKNATQGDKQLEVNSVRGFMPNDVIWIGLGTNQEKKLKITDINSQNNILTLEIAIEHDYSQGTSVMLSSDSNLNPPLLQPLKLSCEYKDNFLLSACRTHNNPNYIDISTAITEVGNSNQNQLQLKNIQGWEVSEQLLIIAQDEKDEKGERKLSTQKVTIAAIDRSNKKVTLKEPLAQTYNK